MELNVSFVEANRTFSVEFGESIDIGIGDYDTGYQQGYADGEHEGFWSGWYEGYDTGCVEATNDATATAAHIDYGQTAYVKGNKITGIKHRREYTGEIDADVVGQSAYVTLLQDELLATIREEATLFVRVECDTQIAGSVVKTWASNGFLNVIPTYNVNVQTVYRLTSAGAANISGNSEPLYSTNVSANVGLLNITEDGELRWYSGSTGNYKIRKSNFKVIVEW